MSFSKKYKPQPTTCYHGPAGYMGKLVVPAHSDRRGDHLHQAMFGLSVPDNTTELPGLLIC